MTLAVKIDNPIKIAQELDRKTVLSRKELADIRTAGESIKDTDGCLERTNALLTAVQSAVCKDYTNLKKFAVLLKSFTATQSEAIVILKEYSKYI